MAPRAYWKGSLKLSLVSCPVALYPATTSVEKTHFHMINKETGNRLKQQMVDAETGDVVEGEQKARGYELKKGEYIEVDKEELEAVQIESTHTIDIDSFVPVEEIDERYIDRPYYITPDGKAGIDAFAVIRDAMKNKGRVALARIVLTNREHIIAIEPLGKGVLGITLRYPYEDEYENALKTLVRRKAAGKPVKVAEREERPDNVISLMDALQQSPKGRASAKRRARSPARRTAHRTAKKAHRSAARARKAG
jgi:non-homologous end joining protein Ku